MKQKSLLFLTVLFVAIVFSRTTHAGFFDPKLKWYTLSTSHFNINYHDGEEEPAHRMAIITEKVYAELSPRFKWKPWGHTEVVLTDTTDVTNAISTTLPYNYILIFLTAPSGDSTLNYYDNWLEELFTHEFTHTLDLDMYGGIAKPFRWILGRIVTPNGLTPAWIREGVAVQQESLNGKGRANNSFSEMMLRTDILNDQFLAIDQMAGLQYEWPSYNAGYIYGGKFWTYLVDKYGQDKMIEFAHRYSDSMWLFSLNNKARKTYQNKNFIKLKAEWKADLTAKYQKLKAELEAKGLTSLQNLQHVLGSLDNPALSPDGKFIVYSKNDYSNKSEIRRINIDGTGDESITNTRTGNQYSFSSDGKKVVFSSMGTYKNYYRYFDLYELDLDTKNISQLTKGLRAFHPDYSPDGKTIVFVANKLDTTQMFLWDVEKKSATPLTHDTSPVQFSNPRFSRDGKFIAVSVWKEGNRDIYFYDLNGKVIKQITSDPAIDLSPDFSADGQNLFFTSDRTGITNVYRYYLPTGTTEQISNVLTGLFDPQYIDGKVIVQNYYGRGYDLKTFNYTPTIPEITPVIKKRGGGVHPPSVANQPLNDSTTVGGGGRVDPAPTKNVSQQSPSPQPSPTRGENEIETPAPLGEIVGPTKYNPFKKLFLPRYIIPGIFFSDALTLIGTTGSSDPIGRHAWVGNITYRTDAQYLGGGLLYTYNRFRPSFYMGFQDYVVNYGDVFASGQNFYEGRKRAFTGVDYGTEKHNVRGYYFFENRSEHGGVPPGAFVPPTLGNFSGFGVTYQFTRANNFPASISLEGAPRLMLNFEVTDTALGSSPNNEQTIFAGDLREYVALPFDGHVLAFRLAGGINWGDKLLQGTFRLGSAIGESVLSGASPRLYTLRGLPEITFAGERAVLASAEYRLPLAHPQRGLGTGPVQLNKIYMVFFADYGSVFNGNIDFNNFLMGVGAELRGDFILGYGLPLTIRLGYGIIVLGREFIQGLTDPITGAAVSNGTVIFSLGTSF